MTTFIKMTMIVHDLASTFHLLSHHMGIPLQHMAGETMPPAKDSCPMNRERGAGWKRHEDVARAIFIDGFNE